MSAQGCSRKTAERRELPWVTIMKMVCHNRFPQYPISEAASPIWIASENTSRTRSPPQTHLPGRTPPPSRQFSRTSRTSKRFCMSAQGCSRKTAKRREQPWVTIIKILSNSEGVVQIVPILPRLGRVVMWRIAKGLCSARGSRFLLDHQNTLAKLTIKVDK
jgi:hypothetical protein